MKKIKCLIAVMICIIAMNTISYAAATKAATGTKVQVTAVLGDYNTCGNKVKKTNSYNHADLTDITGASQQMGFAFAVYVKQVENQSYKSRVGSVPNEYTHELHLYYDGMTTAQITSLLKDKNYKPYVMLTGYPRSSSTTFSAYLVP